MVEYRFSARPFYWLQVISLYLSGNNAELTGYAYPLGVLARGKLWEMEFVMEVKRIRISKRGMCLACQTLQSFRWILIEPFPWQGMHDIKLSHAFPFLLYLQIFAVRLPFRIANLWDGSIARHTHKSGAITNNFNIRSVSIQTSLRGSIDISKHAKSFSHILNEITFKRNGG